MELVIQRLNGAFYNLADYGVTTLDFQIDAPTPKVFAEEIEGRDGFVDLGATYEGRSMRASFFVRIEDGAEFALRRNEIFRMFASKEAYYVTDSREPGKRWLVRSNGFAIDQLVANKGRFSVDFTSPCAYAESTQTTAELILAQISGAKVQRYTHTTAAFDILNDGDAMVNPRENSLVINFVGASTNLTIKNATTGDEWQYTGTTTASDSVILDGIRATNNGLSIFRNTNRKLITLAPGWNEFEIIGATGAFEITFDFRFYTL
jgi:phage-related protein